MVERVESWAKRECLCVFLLFVRVWEQSERVVGWVLNIKRREKVRCGGLDRFCFGKDLNKERLLVLLCCVVCQLAHEEEEKEGR